MGYDEDTGQVQVEVEKWWQGSESNRRHRDFQSPALPSELPRHRLNEVAYLGGLEPPTFWSVARRSIRLSYRYISGKYSAQNKAYFTSNTASVKSVCNICGTAWSKKYSVNRNESDNGPWAITRRHAKRYRTHVRAYFG